MGETTEQFRALDTEPFGINGDSLDSHQRFRQELGLSFDLLVDDGLQIVRAYGALKPDPDTPGAYLDAVQRTVVIVGKDGRVLYRQTGAPPMEELLAAIRDADDT